jgi:prepilin-type N-terminal cleavage/methylation domain-containing protein
MSRRTGFTLFEVMVALVLTSIVALLAYGTASAGFDSNEQLADYRNNVEAQVIVRALLVDALRHPVEGGGLAMNDTLFILEDRSNEEGVPVDAIRFVSRGVSAPLGTSETWIVTLAPSTEGIRFSALPTGTNALAPIDALIGNAHGLNVRVLDRSADLEWSDRWDVPGRLPAAVALELFSSRGERMGAPLVVHGALEGVR